MSKLDVQVVFDCLCDCVLHELSTKDIIRQLDDTNKIRPLLDFIRDERKSRKLNYINFRMMPKDLIFGWGEWNSGGGCMIWSVDFANGMSAHLSDEWLMVSNVAGTPYWEIEDYEDQAKTHVLEKQLIANCEINWAFLLCPIFGQEQADLMHKDLVKIIETL